MYRFLLAIALMVAMSWTLLAVEPPTTTTENNVTEKTITVAPPAPTDIATDTGFGVTYAKERVIKLPRDANKFFVTVIGNPNDPRFNTIKGWFTTVPTLADLKSQTHFNSISTSQVDYKDKYAKYVPATPLVRVQTAKGGVIYQVSGDNIPMSGESLSRAINTELLDRWRERRQDRNNANPNNNRKNVDVDEDSFDEGEGNLDEENMDDEEDPNGGLKIPDTAPPVLDYLDDKIAVAIAGLLGVIAIGGWFLVQRAKAQNHVL